MFGLGLWGVFSPPKSPLKCFYGSVTHGLFAYSFLNPRGGRGKKKKELEATYIPWDWS